MTTDHASEPDRNATPTRAGRHAAPRTRPSLRSPLTAVAAAAVVLTGAGTAVYLTSDKTIHLEVDGSTRTVEVRAGTVGEALAAHGLHAGTRDLLIPSASTELEDGDRITLTHARPLKVSIDGAERTVWVTAVNVDDALEQIGLRQRNLTLSASRSRRIPLNGLSLSVRTPKTITIVVDGSTRSVDTTSPTVGDALLAAGVTVGPLDQVTPAPHTPITPGLRATVARVEQQTVTEQHPIPFGTERRNDPSLLKGTVRQIQEGEDGLLEISFTLVHVDGQLTGKSESSRRQLSSPRNRVLAIGTKPKPRPAGTTTPTGTGTTAPRSGGLNWSALARCESGGNPRAVSSTGRYRGLYQFSLATWRSVGGSGDPIDASADEQTKRAQILYDRSGRGQWPHCGKYL